MSSITSSRKPGAGYAISAQQARNLHLAVQGLLNPPRAKATRARLLAVIERMRLLQIDTINVVARSPYLVLFSRLGAYDMDWLNQLLKRGSIFECWAHEACFAPSSDFDLHRRDLSLREHHWAHKMARRIHRDNRAGMEKLLSFIRENGPVKASDFEAKTKGAAGWWGWKDEKRWLEALFSLGELMIAQRDGFQRVYDISDRVTAGLRGTHDGASRDPRHEFLAGAVRALGIAQAGWISDYFRLQKKCKDAQLQPLVESGELIRVEVKGWQMPGYVHRDNAALLVRARKSRLRATHTALLSPFDPVVWDRARARAMFGFDYALECYTPAPKRKYGYFVLPILRRGELVGRLDAKAHRAEGAFEIKAIYLDPGTPGSSELASDIADAITASANWHGTPRVILRKSQPREFARPLRAAISKCAGRMPVTKKQRPR